MKKLELLIPPVALLFIFVGLMWFAHQTLPVQLLGDHHTRATILVVVGIGIAISGVVSFKRAKTTVNPMTPEKASSVVDSGVFRFTRNPMYLGMLLCLIGFSAYLSSVSAIILALLFLPYMTRFQIKPEEKALEDLFGSEYNVYKSKVRRWL